MRSDLEADVRRVADRLRSLSQARLAAPPAAPDGGWPPYPSCAQAGRSAADGLAAAAQALEAAAVTVAGVAGVSPDGRDLPRLSDFAVGDQVAVTGHDLLAAMEHVSPDTPVWTSTYGTSPAVDAVAYAARILADVRRRI